MSSAQKKRQIEQHAEDDDEDQTESENSDGHPHPEAYTGNEEIQVDFEGRNPIDTDFHGIRQLLRQLFLKADINVSELADLIIAQNYIGSVVIQSEVDDEDDEDDDEIYDSNMIFGITSAVNLTSRPEAKCIDEIRSYIISKAEKYATDATLKYFRDVFSDDNRPVGLLLNERFINIPAQISVPLLENLCKEIKRATDKHMPYRFIYFIIVIKFYRAKAKKNKPVEDIFTNSEEEILCKEAVASFEYSVQMEADVGTSGDWLEKDSRLEPYRKIVLFDALKLPAVILGIKELINKAE